MNAHVQELIKATNEFRKTLELSVLMGQRWNQKVSQLEMENGLEVIKIDEIECPEWKTLFGTEKDIINPCLKGQTDY